MNAVTHELVALAKSLPPVERAELIESLIDSMQHSDKEIQALWISEAESRVQALLRGEITANPEPKVLTEFRARQR